MLVVKLLMNGFILANCFYINIYEADNATWKFISNGAAYHWLDGGYSEKTVTTQIKTQTGPFKTFSYQKCRCFSIGYGYLLNSHYYV